LITIAVLALNLHRLPIELDTLWLVGPSITLTIAATLSLSYNRSRVFLVCCILAVCLWVHAQAIDDGLKEFIIIGGASLNISLICLYRERGAFTAYGLFRFLIIAGEVGLVVYFIDRQIELPIALLDPFTAPLAPILQFSPFHQIPTLLLAGSLGGCLFFMGLDDTPITQGLSTALVGLALAFGMSVNHGWEVFLMAGSLYLGASIIRDSYNMAYRDELTGLAHRRAMNEQFLALGSKYSLAMLDVDHFKKFNDTHGHDIGDQVLQMVAIKIGQVNGGGKAFRYGGEEFSIIFPRLSKEDAFYYLDEVRTNIQNYEMVVRSEPREEEQKDNSQRDQRLRGSFRTAGQKVSVTISIGVADRADSSQTPDDVLKVADTALYRAKKAGRNKVIVSQ